MADLTKKSDGRGFWGSLLRLKREPEEIHGLHVGAIVSAEDLLVAETAAVAGDLVAPRVTVEGLVYGHIGAREVVVGETGQIWGDVYGTAVHIEPGAKVYGWLTTIAETTAAQLLNQESDLADLTPGANAIPPDVLEQAGLSALLQTAGSLPPEERLNLLHDMQAAAGEALTARAELESEFDQKVHERANEALNEAVHLRESVAVLRDHVASLQEAALARDDEIGGQQTELTAVRELLQERTVERDELRAFAKQRQAELEKLHDNHETLRQKYETAEAERKSLSERLSGMESAFQASLQRAAEQEDALIHWQELADSTERQAAALEKDLAKSQHANQESSQRIELLQGQKQKLQEACEQIQAQLTDWQSKAGNVAVQSSEYEAQIAALQEQLNSRPPVSEETTAELTAVQAELEKANGRVAELESYLQRLEVEAKDYFDQLISYKTDLEESRKQLTGLQTALRERTEQLARAQAEMGERQDQVDKWKANVGRMTELLYDAEQRAKDLRQELDSKQTTGPEDKKLRELLQQHQVQLDASEAEASRYHQEMETQSQRLAETQATLIEREVALGRTESALAQKDEELNRLKKAAVTRIQKLEKELAHAREGKSSP